MNKKIEQALYIAATYDVNCTLTSKDCWELLAHIQGLEASVNHLMADNRRLENELQDN